MMEKVICDVCGADYPETAAQCPLCGCARADGGQTSAGNTDGESTYTYTKGGRFSKSNVRKRLKAAQIQPVPVEMPVRTPEPEDDPDYDDYDDYDEDEVEEPSSNRGLIAIVVLLLLAIIAVSSYIAIVHFDIFGSNGETKPVVTTGPSQSTTAPTDDIGIRIPCTGLTVNGDISLTQKGKTVQLSISTEPLDTTDEITYKSSNVAVATVDEYGYVTAVGDGEVTITITCGDFVKECKVSCDFSGNDQPSTPTEPTVPVEPVLQYQLKLNGAKPNYPIGDYSCEATFKTGASFTLKVVDENGKAMDVVWSASKDSYVTINGNTIKCYKPVNSITISGTYAGKTYSCIVHINGTPIDFPTEEPETPETPETPDEPTVVYSLKIDQADPNYKYNDQENSADVTYEVGKKFRLQLEDPETFKIINDAQWIISDASKCSIAGEYVTCLSKGTCRITTTYKGVTYLVYVRITEQTN